MTLEVAHVCAVDTPTIAIPWSDAVVALGFSGGRCLLCRGAGTVWVQQRVGGLALDGSLRWAGRRFPCAPCAGKGGWQA